MNEAETRAEHNSNRMYKAGVDQIDHHIPEKYTRADVVKLLDMN